MFVIAAEKPFGRMTVKLQKWPPSVNGVFPADAKRSLQLQLEPTHPSLDECTEEIKKAYGSMLSIKIYFYDGFKVMPAVREEYFTFCMKRFKMNYANFVNHIDMNRLYIVANPTKRSCESEKLPTSCPVTRGELSNVSSKDDFDFSARVKKAFPTVEIIPGNKFKCMCGQIGALNGQRRMGNIKRHVNTTCRLKGKRLGGTLNDYFRKNASPVQEEQS